MALPRTTIQASRDLNEKLKYNKNAYMKDSAMMSRLIDETSAVAKDAKDSRASASVNKTFVTITATVGQVARELSRALAADPGELMSAISKQYPGGSTSVNWAAVGRQCAPFFRDLPMPPVVYFLFGPLQGIEGKTKEVKLREKKIKVHENLEERAPEEATAAVKGEEKEARSSRIAEGIYTDLLAARVGKSPLYKAVTLADGSSKDMFDMVETLFDPWSYSQTVENIFYFSFMVKQGRCGVYFIPKEGPSGAGPGWPHIMVYTYAETVAILDSPHMVLSNDGRPGDVALADHAASKAGRSAKAARAHDVQGNSQQFILEIDNDSWARLVRAGKLTRPFLPHKKMPDCCCPAGTKHAGDAEMPGNGAVGTSSKG